MDGVEAVNTGYAFGECLCFEKSAPIGQHKLVHCTEVTTRSSAPCMGKWDIS